METIVKADIFFFITSLAVIIITSVTLVIGLYVIRILRDVRAIVEHLKVIGGKVEDEFEDMYADLMSRWPLRLLFKPKRKSHKS
jgi:hypothetical protein